MKIRNASIAEDSKGTSGASALRAVILATCAAVLTQAFQGCATTTAGSTDVGHYVVSVPQTPMFRYGPAQSFGADFNLQQGQHVVMLKREFGYSRVQTDDGQSGYVATEDLAPSPPPKPGARGGASLAGTSGSRGYPKLPPMRPTGTSRQGISSANNQILQGGELFGPDELPPLPTRGDDDGEKRPNAKPDFRFPRPKPGFRINVTQPDLSNPPAEKKE